MTTDLEQILTSIAALSTDIKDLRHDVDTKVSHLETKVSELDSKMEISNTKFDNYQKATQWVVNLAFSLIASATLVTIVSSVFRR